MRLAQTLGGEDGNSKRHNMLGGTVVGQSPYPIERQYRLFSLPGADRLQFRDYPGDCNTPSNFETYPRLQS
jgi:hypothetical protein